MSSGISALKGFDYQATVTLDRLFNHFDRFSGSTQARPEGIDDLDFAWVAEDGTELSRYEQIKKPRENFEGKRTPKAWTLQDSIDELLPNTLAHLAGNTHEQVWILGDEVEAGLAALVDAGENAPGAVAASYWRVVHTLARNDALIGVPLEPGVRLKILRWRIKDDVPVDASTAFLHVVDGFCTLVEDVGLKQLANRYRERAQEIHACLPDVLSRVRIESLYGTEEAVTRRVHERLAETYALAPSIIETTLFRNLRGFINDIAKQPNRRFDREELEYELRCVWPQMLSVKDPPPLVEGYVARPDLTSCLTDSTTSRTIEAIGVSGSGKTMLAADAISRSRTVDPQRIALYIEVRPDDGLRDALVGVAFHMRRFGAPEPFGIAVEGSATDQDVVAQLARSFAGASRDMLLVMDLVQGTCSDAFSRDLAIFVRCLSSTACRIMVFGQESALRGLTALERDQHGVRHTDIRGFRFEEFVELVSQSHLDPDRSRLWDVFQRVTAGRSAGLFAGLAQSLSRAPSVDAMAEIASRPSEDMLPYAEQQRFARISSGARAAAEQLVCIALPFTRSDAAAIFANDNVGLAIRELSMLGLLRANDEETFEMHEIIRAGLEGMLARAVRQRAHAALAAWYRDRGVVAAEILHLQESGDDSGAKRRAREVFLRGEAWASLAALIAMYKLVSVREVIEVFESAAPVDSRYLFADILRGLDGPVPVEELVRLLRDQPDRFFRDYQWASAIIDAILGFEPARLDDIIAIVLRMPSDPQRRQESALSMIRVGLRRIGATITPTTISFFASAPSESKGLLLPFMLFDSRRDALRPAFEFIVSGEKPFQGVRTTPWSGLTLKIEHRTDAIAILSSLPDVEIAAMLVAKSPLLGEIAPLLWQQRTALRTHCVEILRSDEDDAKVLESAIRILIFLMQPDICAICEAVAARSSGKIRSFASMALALVPNLVDKDRQEARFLDPAVAIADRVVALSVLASAGAEMGHLYNRMKAVESAREGMGLWDFFFLQLCGQAPFKEAIPLLEDHLRSEAANSAGVFLSAFIELGALPEAAPMLRQALSHPNPRIRQVAATALGERRSKAALPALIAQYGMEHDEGTVVGLATAIVASAPTATACLESGRPATPALRLWQCILATRLRDESFAERIVAIATDRSLNWQLRRAAITAAGRLPFDTALVRIVPTVMQERTSLTIDGDQVLSCHSTLSTLLVTEAAGMQRIFVQGRGRFIDFFDEILAPSEGRSASGLPTGADVSGWLYDRLLHCGWPSEIEAPDLVLNELHVPLLQSAVLRALRHAGRHDLIEAEIPRTYHVWLALKCLLERLRARPRDPNLVARLKALIAASPFKNEDVLARVLDNMGGGAHVIMPTPQADPHPTEKAEGASSRSLSYDDAVRLLTGDGADASAEPARPWVLDAVTRDEFEHLISLATPSNDRFRTVETYVPLVSFTHNGHSVSQRRSTTTNATEPEGASIRPAIAAANVFGVNIAWHEELMTGVFAQSYIPRLLACLDAQGDGARFYDELFLHPNTLLPHLCTAAQPRFAKHLDARIVPLLSMYAPSGTDELFETMCGLARAIDVPEIDPVLHSLFTRWVQSFNLRSPYLQHTENYPLWRGFSLLTSHPRFDLVEDWQSSLASVLRAQLRWYHRQTIARVVERHPRSYIQIEALLFRAEDWEHFHEDEIDRLDAAASRLFSETTE